MSRTDVHRPMRALIQDPTVRHWFTTHHHHEVGICDLAEHLAGTRHGVWKRTNCYILPSASSPNLCGCWMCTDRDERRRDRRRERANGRKACRDWRKEWE